MAPLLALLLAADVPRIAVTPLEGDLFRVTVLHSERDLLDHARAQIDLARAARRHCKGRGTAAGGDTLIVDDVPKGDPRRKRGRLALSADYRCIASAEGRR